MVAKIQLIGQENFYYLFVFTNPESDSPKLKICFPYDKSNKQEQLKKATGLGEELAESFNTTLEENLNQPSNA